MAGTGLEPCFSGPIQEFPCCAGHRLRTSPAPAPSSSLPFFSHHPPPPPRPAWDRTDPSQRLHLLTEAWVQPPCLQQPSVSVPVDLPGPGSLLSALLALNLASQEGRGRVEQQGCHLQCITSGPLPLPPALPRGQRHPPGQLQVWMSWMGPTGQGSSWAEAPSCLPRA